VTRLRRTLAAERGIALPLALGVLFVVAGLATVAARAAINANHSSFRDSNVKRAIQAANAGIKAASYQLNLLQPLPSECVLRATSGGPLSTAAATGSWCPTQTEDLGGNASYTFQVSQSTPLSYNSNGQVVTERSLVSTGTVNGQSRRVFVRVTAPGGTPLFPKNYAAVSLNSVNFGNSGTITGWLGSNGNITLQNTFKVSGEAHPGTGKTVTLQNQASVTGSKTPATEPFSFSPVNQRSAPTVNNNSRIGTLDPWTSPGDISWNPTTRVLDMSKTSTLTLSGDVYSFCRITMTQSATIKIAARGPLQLPLRIYMDTPENCGGSSGMGSVSLNQSSSFQNLNSSPASFLLAVSGSATKATSVDFGQASAPGTQTVMGIYAPFSTVSMNNSVDYVGAVVAKQVQLSNSVKLTYDPLIQNLSEDPLFVYHRTEYLECTNVATTTTPDSGC